MSNNMPAHTHSERCWWPREFFPAHHCPDWPAEPIQKPGPQPWNANLAGTAQEQLAKALGSSALPEADQPHSADEEPLNPEFGIYTPPVPELSLREVKALVERHREELQTVWLDLMGEDVAEIAAEVARFILGGLEKTNDKAS